MRILAEITRSRPGRSIPTASACEIPAAPPSSTAGLTYPPLPPQGPQCPEERAELANHASELPSSGASASGAGGDAGRAAIAHDLPQDAASQSGTPLPMLPPLPAPMQMADGSEQFPVPQTVDEPLEVLTPEEGQNDGE